MSPLQILHERFADAMIVTIIGQMDESNADAKAPEIYALIEQIPYGGTLILNFSGLEYMNSKSIGYTMDFYNKMVEKGGDIMIAEAQEQIADILNVVGITNVIPMVASLMEAKAKLGGGSVTFSTPQSPVVAVSEPDVVLELPVQHVEEHSFSLASEASVNEEMPQTVLATPQIAIEEKKPVYADLASEIAEQMKMKQGLSQKQEDALETFLQDDQAVENNVEPEKEEVVVESTPVMQTPTSQVRNTSSQEKEFPLLAVSVIVGLAVILLVLFLK